jgi:hypothetical protein
MLYTLEAAVTCIRLTGYRYINIGIQEMQFRGPFLTVRRRCDSEGALDATLVNSEIRGKMLKNSMTN